MAGSSMTTGCIPGRDKPECEPSAFHIYDARTGMASSNSPGENITSLREEEPAEEAPANQSGISRCYDTNSLAVSEQNAAFYGGGFNMG